MHCIFWVLMVVVAVVLVIVAVIVVVNALSQFGDLHLRWVYTKDRSCIPACLIGFLFWPFLLLCSAPKITTYVFREAFGPKIHPKTTTVVLRPIWDTLPRLLNRLKSVMNLPLPLPLSLSLSLTLAQSLTLSHSLTLSLSHSLSHSLTLSHSLALSPLVLSLSRALSLSLAHTLSLSLYLFHRVWGLSQRLKPCDSNECLTERACSVPLVLCLATIDYTVSQHSKRHDCKIECVPGVS